MTSPAVMPHYAVSVSWDDGLCKPCRKSADAFVQNLECQVVRKSEEDRAVRERRDQLLDSLGRIRALNLRAKIFSRYDTLAEVLKQQLPGMHDVIRYCVLVRSYFVHGRKLSVTPDAAYELAPFFTDTLEFIFAVSDLQSCGWNVERWASESFGSSRLKTYLYGYNENCKRLRAAGGIVSS